MYHTRNPLRIILSDIIGDHNIRTKRNPRKQSVKMDMLHGSLFDKMLMFAMPLAACSILQQLFNSVGTAVVGRFASSEALAEVGSNSSVIALMVTLFSGISLGSNVVIANYIGQNDTKRIPKKEGE